MELKKLELHKVMGLSLLPLIRLVSDRCRVMQMAIDLVKNYCEIYDSSMLQEGVLKPGNELAFLHFGFPHLKVNGFFEWVLVGCPK